MIPHKRNHRFTVGLLVLLSAGSLVACSTLPTSGSPQAFDLRVPQTAPIDFAAGGPVENSSPEQLIQDFLLACAAGFADDFATARLFLTSASAQQWNPTDHVQVFATDTSPQVAITDASDDQTQVSLQLPGVASVDSSGILTRVVGSNIEAHYTLVKESGQWRIHKPSPGILMSQASFSNAFARANLYFPARTGDALIADPRWYPARRQATHLVQGLISGPRPELHSVVTNAVPEDASIDSQSVEVVDGIAKVLLTASIPQDPTTQTALKWQIVRTLTGARNVSKVNLTVSGENLVSESEDGDSASALPIGPEYALDTPVVMTENGLGRLSGGNVSLWLAKPKGELTAVTSGPLLDSPVAWLSGAELNIAERSSTEPVVIDLARAEGPASASDSPRDLRTTVEAISAGQGRISIDRFGWVWVTPSATGRIYVWNMQEAETQVAVDSAIEKNMTAVKVSPDGSRVLFVSEGSAWIGVVERDSTGKPTAVIDVRTLPEVSSGVLDVSWAGESVIMAVIKSSRAQDAERSLVTVDLGGFATTTVLPAGTSSLTAGAVPSSLVINVDGSGLQSRAGALWQAVSPSIIELSYPG